jgi:outer membrane protein TolC
MTFGRARRQPIERFGALALSVCVATSTAAPAWAADHPSAAPLSLPQLLQEARQANPDLLAARKRWEAAQAKVGQATGLPAPRIGVEFEEIPKGSVKINQATVMYQLIQALPFPGKLSLRKKVAVKEAQIAASVYKQTEWDIISQLKAGYYDLFLLDRELEIQQELDVWLSQAVADAQAKYATGAIPQTDALQAQAEAVEAANEIKVLTHQREALGAHINHLLNRPIHEPLAHPAPIELMPLAFSPDELLVLAYETQPELLAFRYSAERAEAAWKLAKRELLPDLETMAELRDPAMGPIGPWDLTLALVIPFWFWTKARYGVRAALYDKDSAQAAYQAMRNAIAKRIHEHWHEAWASYQSALLYRDGLIPMGRQAVGSAMAAYRAGRGSFMDLLDALRTLSERERAYYRHLVSLEQHVAMLEQSAGVALRAAHQEVSP